MFKKIIFSIILCSAFLVTAYAQSDFVVIKRQDLQLDDSFSGALEPVYARPQRIFVAQINPEHSYFLNDSKSWIRLFHYYGATRLKLPEIPFNYIIDRSGNIYEILENAEGRMPYVEAEEGTILIGYFSDGSDFTLPAQKAFKGLIENYSYKFGIVKENVQSVQLSLPEKEDDLLSYKPVEGVFKLTFLEMIQKFEYFSESHLRFSGEIRDLQYEKNIASGENLKVEFTLKNTDLFPWYISDGFVFLSTIDRKESIFAINQVWDSFSKPLSLDSQILLPNEDIKVSFEMRTEGVVPDKYEVGFKFVMLPDIDIAGTEFTLNFVIDKGDRKVVQIRPTGTGGLTVYGCPSHSCEMVAGARTGQKYLVLAEEGRWYKINVDGVEGWVIMNYATLVD